MLKGFEELQNNKEVYVIAEIGLNHNGSAELAERLIDVAIVAGANAVKFQKRTVDQIAIRSVLDAEDDRFPEFGKTYGDIRTHLEFGWDEYKGLKSYCDERNIEFLCTPFDLDAVDFLERLGVNGYKLASHSLTNLPLLKYVAGIGKPTMLSTGMCEIGELDGAVDVFRRTGTPLVLLHCVSVYPTPAEQCNLSLIPFLRERYGVPVGYSGHEIGFLPTLAAVGVGACVIERHITLDRTMAGFDHKLSLEPDGLVRMVEDIQNICKALGNESKYVSDQEMITRRKYHVSMVSASHIPQGSTLSADMVTYKNPGAGVPPKDAHKLLGKRAIQDIPADVLLTFTMFV